MIHAFQTQDANEYGLIQAVLLHNFRHWISFNQANGKHLHDGHTWTYNSVKAFGALFPYLSKDQIRRGIEGLIEKGVLLRGNFNESAYDKTSWFAFADEAFSQLDLANLPNGSGESANSETDSKHRLKTKPTTREACVLPEIFEPNQACVDKAAALGVNLETEFPAFRDHHLARNTTFVDWQAALRTWLHNAAKFAKRDQGTARIRVAGTNKHAAAAGAIWGKDDEARTVDA